MAVAPGACFLAARPHLLKVPQPSPNLAVAGEQVGDILDPNHPAPTVYIEMHHLSAILPRISHVHHTYIFYILSDCEWLTRPM